MNLTKKWKLSMFIAYVQLKSKLTQTLIAVVSVTFGIAVFIYLIGYINGVNKFITQMTLKESPDIRLFIEEHPSEINVIDKVFPADVNSVSHVKLKHLLPNLKDGKKALKEIKEDYRVKAIASDVKTQVFYHLGATHVSGELTGVNIKDENELFNLEDKLVAGSFDDLDTKLNRLIMGEKLKERLNVALGDKIRITTEKGTSVIGVLAGYIKTGIPEIDKKICYTSEKTIQNLLGVSNTYITEVKLKLNDPSLAPEMALELAEKYSYNSSNWQIDNASLFEGEEIQDMIFNCIAVSILFVAGFGIFNILNMMIYEKMKDIAIIKAMGFSDGDVKIVFVSQALVIGIIGGLSGVLLGFLLSYGTSLLPYESDVFVSIDHLPMNFSYIIYFNGFCFAMLTTYLSGYLPAKKASRLDPVTVLRG